MSVFTIDLGHTLTGGDTGASGNGLREENLTREIGNLVAIGLRKAGHTAHIIQLDYARTMPESLNYRVDRIIEIKPDQSVSIHINSAVNPLATGVEVWGDNLCKDMCNRICGNISSQFNISNRGFKHGVESLALVGLYGQSNIPALLVECFFICNANDCNKYNAQKYADCIIAGILNKSVSTVNNNYEKVEYDMNKIVVYFGDADLFGAVMVAQKNQCALMKLSDYKASGLKVKEVIQIGGKVNDTNRYVTFKNAAALV